MSSNNLLLISTDTCFTYSYLFFLSLPIIPGKNNKNSSDNSQRNSRLIHVVHFKVSLEKGSRRLERAAENNPI